MARLPHHRFKVTEKRFYLKKKNVFQSSLEGYGKKFCSNKNVFI